MRTLSQTAHMAGMNRTTGQSIDGAEHLIQSVRDILFTMLGTRVMRRAYGSRLMALIDAPLTNETISDFYAAIILALLRWEPRIRPTRVWFSGAPRDAANGVIQFNLAGFYRVNGAPIQVVVPL